MDSKLNKIFMTTLILFGLQKEYKYYWDIYMKLKLLYHKNMKMN